MVQRSSRSLTGRFFQDKGIGKAVPEKIFLPEPCSTGQAADRAVGLEMGIPDGLFNEQDASGLQGVKEFP